MRVGWYARRRRARNLMCVACRCQPAGVKGCGCTCCCAGFECGSCAAAVSLGSRSQIIRGPGAHSCARDKPTQTQHTRLLPAWFRVFVSCVFFTCIVCSVNMNLAVGLRLSRRSTHAYRSTRMCMLDCVLPGAARAHACVAAPSLQHCNLSSRTRATVRHAGALAQSTNGCPGGWRAQHAPPRAAYDPAARPVAEPQRWRGALLSSACSAKLSPRRRRQPSPDLQQPQNNQPTGFLSCNRRSLGCPSQEPRLPPHAASSASHARLGACCCFSAPAWPLQASIGIAASLDGHVAASST